MRGLAAPLVKLAVFLVITITATYILAATIANSNQGSTRGYQAYFTDATGLLVGDDVRIAGVRVGAIKGIDLVHHDLADVHFTVQKDRPLPASAIARLRYRNLVGQRYLALEEGAGDPSKLQDPKTPIPTSRTQNALDLTTLFGGFKPLFQGLNPSEINSLSLEIIQALQGEGGSVALLLSRTADLTNALADKDKVIGDLIDNLSSVLDTVGRRDQEFDNLIVQFQRFLSGLAADRTAIGNSLDGINGLAATTTSLLQSVRPVVKNDVVDLTALASNLNQGGATINGVLQRLPTKLATVTRTATYGSWFNFFLCNAGGYTVLPVIGKTGVGLPTQTPARCT